MSAFNYMDVRSQSNVKIATVRDHIDGLLAAGAYDVMEPYLLPSGVRGSKAFDQAECVAILHDQDVKLAGEKGIIESDRALPKFGMKDRQLWDILCSVLRRSGFRISHGRVLGLIEHSKPTTKPSDDQPGDQPDVD